MSTILAFIFVIGILVFVHELGHFLLAKRAGIRVEKFSLGFGKTLFSFRKGETEYLISALPLGGYVKMFGEGGEGALIIEEAEAGSRAAKSRFMSGDKIVGIDGIELKEYSKWNDLRSALAADGNRKYAIEIERWGERQTIEAAPDDLTGARIFSEQEYSRSFANKSILDRLKVIVAGPFMNLAFPFVVMPIVFMIGIAIPKYLEESPVIGYVEPDSIAARAGFLPGDVITEIKGKEVSNWKDVNLQFGINPGSTIPIDIERGSSIVEINIDTPREPGTMDTIGISPPLEPRVGGLLPGAPAERAGLVKGDVILSIDGTAVSHWNQMAKIIRKNEGKEITLEVKRGSRTLKVALTPVSLQQKGKGAIGISPWMNEITKKYGFFNAIVEGVSAAFKLVVNMTLLLVGFVVKLITGQIALSTAGKTIAGPIAIAKFSGSAAQGGLASLLQFTVFISVNLGIINLFPIPMLDGGHVVYLTIEAVRKRPLSMKTLEIVQRVGFAFLMFIMFVAVYNDISRLGILDMIGKLFK